MNTEVEPRVSAPYFGGLTQNRSASDNGKTGCQHLQPSVAINSASDVSSCTQDGGVMSATAVDEVGTSTSFDPYRVNCVGKDDAFCTSRTCSG